MITFELLTKDNMNENSLDNYDRKQNVQRVYRKINNEYIIVNDEWMMDWSLERKRTVAKSLFHEDYIAFGALDNGKIIGFASIEKKNAR